jgi:outer membrane protein OmpA-like peptidoglycan-associated protein
MALPRRAILFLAALASVPFLGAQQGPGSGALPDAAVFADPALLPPGSGFDLVERSDYRRYVDGRLSGFIYRESRASFRETASASSGQPAWKGDLYLLEETIHDEAISARKVARVLELDLVSSGGRVAQTGDAGFPAHRGLLAGRPADLAEGSTWIGAAAMALDPHNSGNFILLPVLVEYHVAGKAEYDGSPAILIKAKFAVRYDSSRSASARPSGSASSGGQATDSLRAISGTHDLDIYLDAMRGSLVFIRDRFDESYSFNSGVTERHAGFTLVFYAPSLRGERDAAIASLGARPAAAGQPALPSSQGTKPSAAPATVPVPVPAPVPGAAATPAPAQPATGPGAASPASSSVGPPAPSAGEGDELEEGPALIAAGVDLLESPAGLVFRIKDLQFVADSDELLPVARGRLDEIAAILRGFPDRNFLVEGHAAGVGKPAGELDLSEKRALRVVKELIARGIPASRFTWRGLGSSKPIASNATEEGRSRNRRVEITLLE